MSPSKCEHFLRSGLQDRVVNTTRVRRVDAVKCPRNCRGLTLPSAASH
jgi:hypothetical protein